jgi:hypothetical protein
MQRYVSSRSVEETTPVETTPVESTPVEITPVETPPPAEITRESPTFGAEADFGGDFSEQVIWGGEVDSIDGEDDLVFEEEHDESHSQLVVPGDAPLERQEE